MTALDPATVATLTVIISVLCHVTAAIWYTRKQRVYFERRMDAMVSPIAEDVKTVRTWAAADALPTSDVKELLTTLKGPIQVALPEDFNQRIRESMQSWANGERAKTAAAMEEGEQVASMEYAAAGGDNDLMELANFLGLDAETKRKLYAGARYLEKMRGRRQAGEHLFQLGSLGSYG